VQPRVCRPYRAQTKGKIERPFFYLEEPFLNGRSFGSVLELHNQLARFEEDDLDVYVHASTQERAIDRFQSELPHLTPLPKQRFVGTLSLSRKVSWDCLVSFRGSRYSVPAVCAGKRVWLLVSRGTHLVILDAQRPTQAESDVAVSAGYAQAEPLEEICCGAEADYVETPEHIAARMLREVAAVLARESRSSAELPELGARLAAVPHNAQHDALLRGRPSGGHNQ
jgi:Mu transposase, C-terminal domain